LIKAFDPGLFQGNADNKRTVDTGDEAEERDPGRRMGNQIEWTPVLVTLAIIVSFLGFPMIRRFMPR